MSLGQNEWSRHNWKGYIKVKTEKFSVIYCLIYFIISDDTQLTTPYVCDKIYGRYGIEYIRGAIFEY